MHMTKGGWGQFHDDFATLDQLPWWITINMVSQYVHVYIYRYIYICIDIYIYIYICACIYIYRDAAL